MFDFEEKPKFSAHHHHPLLFVRSLVVMHSLSIERESSDTQALTSGDSHILASAAVEKRLEEYATGPEKPAKIECCKFRTRIPHYIWSNKPLTCCQGGCEMCGFQWRTCHRVGNFTAVLERVDEEAGTRELCLVVGPHWPFACIFTATLLVAFPLVSIVLFWGVVPAWACVGLAAASALNLLLLAWLGCGDPGIAKRRHHKPSMPSSSSSEGLESGSGPASGDLGDQAAQFKNKKWLWNDQASTWRAQTDSYSQEMNVVLHNVDHICPFTGTAIARRNMGRFIIFQVGIIALGFSVVIFISWGLIISFPELR